MEGSRYPASSSMLGRVGLAGFGEVSRKRGGHAETLAEGGTGIPLTHDDKSIAIRRMVCYLCCCVAKH